MPSQLVVRGSIPSNIFALLGQDENSATYALGWTLAKCPALLSAFVCQTIGGPISNEQQVSVELQRSHDEGGFTDIEIIAPGQLHLIVEAKRDWLLPSVEQLARYRLRVRPEHFAKTALVSISAAPKEFAVTRMPSSLDGVPTTHQSWANVQSLVRAAFNQTVNFEQRLWLRALDKHLGAYVSMQNPRDNLVLVVVLSAEPIRDSSPYNWIDVVEKDGRYFHPYGNRWPLLPPNYIGFRHGGRLRSVHHIDGHEIVGDLATIDARWPTTEGEHFLYQLGPPMRPPIEVTNGRIHAQGHVRCAIDTLLSGAFSTISDARDETNRRLADAEFTDAR